MRLLLAIAFTFTFTSQALASGPCEKPSACSDPISREVPVAQPAATPAPHLNVREARAVSRVTGYTIVAPFSNTEPTIHVRCQPDGNAFHCTVNARAERLHVVFNTRVSERRGALHTRASNLRVV